MVRISLRQVGLTRGNSHHCWGISASRHSAMSHAVTGGHLITSRNPRRGNSPFRCRDGNVAPGPLPLGGYEPRMRGIADAYSAKKTTLAGSWGACTVIELSMARQCPRILGKPPAISPATEKKGGVRLWERLDREPHRRSMEASRRHCVWCGAPPRPASPSCDGGIRSMAEAGFQAVPRNPTRPQNARRSPARS
jgi:hypothetical protein